jgi:hypothetical protein
MADLLAYLVRLADVLEIDLAEVSRKKLEKLSRAIPGRGGPYVSGLGEGNSSRASRLPSAPLTTSRTWPRFKRLDRNSAPTLSRTPLGQVGQFDRGVGLASGVAGGRG